MALWFWNLLCLCVLIWNCVSFVFPRSFVLKIRFLPHFHYMVPTHLSSTKSLLLFHFKSLVAGAWYPTQSSFSTTYIMILSSWGDVKKWTCNTGLYMQTLTYVWPSCRSLDIETWKFGKNFSFSIPLPCCFLFKYKFSFHCGKQTQRIKNTIDCTVVHVWLYIQSVGFVPQQFPTTSCRISGKQPPNSKSNSCQAKLRWAEYYAGENWHLIARSQVSHPPKGREHKLTPGFHPLDWSNWLRLHEMILQRCAFPAKTFKTLLFWSRWTSYRSYLCINKVL